MDDIVGTFSVKYVLGILDLPEGKFWKIESHLLDKPVLARNKDTVMRMFYLALADKYKWVPEKS